MRITLSILAVAGAFGACAPAMAVQPARPAGTCHFALPIAADNESFTNAGRSGAEASARETGLAFTAAAGHLCAAGIMRPAHVARYRSLLVRDAEGATNPNIYDDAEEHPGALIIEYAFTGDAPPTQAQIEAALRCWRNPQGAGCATEDVGP